MTTTTVNATRNPLDILFTVMHNNTQQAKAEQRQAREANRNREIEFARNKREAKARGNQLQESGPSNN